MNLHNVQPGVFVKREWGQNGPFRKELFRQAYEVIHTLEQQDPETFAVLFRDGNVMNLPKGVYAPLLDLGLINSVDGKGSFKANGRISGLLQGCYFVTDFPSLKERNRVFPTYLDESGYVAGLIAADQKDKRSFLDIGTGSGIFPIVAAKTGSKTIHATDINWKALQYARFNAELNGVAEKIAFYHGDGCEPLPCQHYGLIVSNPPFVPTPENFRGYIHSVGGPTGTEIAERVVTSAVDRLKRSGRLWVITLALGSKERPAYFLQFLESLSLARDLQISVRPLYESSESLARTYFKVYRRVEGFERWRRDLIERGLTHIHYLFITVEKGRIGEPIFLSRKSDFEVTQHSGNWSRRMNRFSMPQSSSDSQ